jgi:hypothetical protein
MSYSSKWAVKQLRRVPDMSKEPVLAYLGQTNQQWQKRLREVTCEQWTSLSAKYEDCSRAAWWRTGSEVAARRPVSRTGKMLAINTLARTLRAPTRCTCGGKGAAE